MFAASFIVLAVAAGPFALMYLLARERPKLRPVRIKSWNRNPR